jgi:hypothetical protein
MRLGVKTERIRTDSSETVRIRYHIFFGFRIRADSVRIRIRNQSLTGGKKAFNPGL